MINPEMSHCSVIVTGSGGRVGRALRAVWGGKVAGCPILWLARKPAEGIDIAWDIGKDGVPALPSGAIFVHLAGQTRGDVAALAENRRSAALLCAAAQQVAARHIFFMSSAAVYRPDSALLEEIRTPDPINDYGHAKLAAEQVMSAQIPASTLTILRLANLAGADSLLSGAARGPVALDPIDGQPGGPVRSCIGPRALAAALERLIAMAAAGNALPGVINLAQEPALQMADLLTAFGASWQFGPPRAAAVAKVALSVARLNAIISLPKATAEGIVSDLNSLKGSWP